MQKKYTHRFSVLFTLLLFSTALLAQETQAIGEKKVFISIKGTDAKGRTMTRTMTLTGEDAKNFDVKKYIHANTTDLTNVVVNIDDKNNINDPNNWLKNKHHYGTYVSDNNVTIKKEQHGFLGVSQKNTDFDNEACVSVKITQNSGAAKAGLIDGDVILQLNEKSINTFNDISVFMRTTQPNDKVRVRVSRNGETKSFTATVGQTENTWAVNTQEKEKEACLGVYTSTSRNTLRGAVIQDFTPVSAAQEVSMQLGDKITAINGINVNSHQELWDEIAKYKPNQKVRVSYIRKGDDKLIVTTLKACKPTDEKVNIVPAAPQNAKKIDLSVNKQLKLDKFSTFPNPIQDMVNITFQGEAVPTTVSLIDLTGRVLFQQILNDFNGDYNQRFDVSAYQKGVILVRVLQGDKVFSEKLVVN